MRPLVIARIGLLVAVGSAWPAAAHAYPQWQLSAGASRCNQCHVTPTGGGLLTSYGRRAVGDRLSTFSGDGELLNGAATLPGWLRWGADLRGGYLAEDARDASGAPRAVFPLEVESQAMISLADVSLYGTLGMRGQMPGDDAAIAPVPAQNYQPIAMPWLVSREHWLMWRRAGLGLYLRAGRFFAPYGLRLAESITYVRRDLGFNELGESYNLSGGYVADRWELHLTLFAPDVLRHLGGDETGAAAYVERRTGAGALALQARYAARTDVTRAMAGAVAKYYVAPLRTLFMAEADTVLLSVNGVRARGQAVGLLGAAVLPVRGVMVTALAELFQEDLRVRAAARSAGSLLLDWFPYAHVGTQVMARVDLAVGADAAKLLFAQLRYFL